MAVVDVEVLRVFTDPEGRHGNPLGIIEGSDVPALQRQAVAAALGYSETVFVDDRDAGRIQIFTPAAELRFAGHPTVGTAWWLRSQGHAAEILRVPAGDVVVERSGDLTSVRGRADWGPTFAWHQLPDAAAVVAADPESFPANHSYVWAWADETAGVVRSRMFSPVLGIAEDEATGSAAVALTSRLGRALRVIQGRGSELRTTSEGDGWATVGGRVVHDGRRRVTIPGPPGHPGSPGSPQLPRSR